MDGVHDMGGMHGFGRVVIDPDEPVFAAEWERRVFAMTLVSLGVGLFNLDEFRYATEREDPVRYLSSPYYEHWLSALELLYEEKGALGADELREGETSDLASAMRDLIRTGASVRREPSAEPLFRPGDRVRARNIHPRTHTRLPRYARGRIGTVTASHGAFVFPDSHAHGKGEDPQHLYSVLFEAPELWGTDRTCQDSVSLDLWESYLERPAHANA